jgi:hypothetical protein
MESRGGEDWLRPSHPLHDERELGDQDEVTYAIAARLPACALWNLFEWLSGFDSFKPDHRWIRIGCRR